MPSEAPSELEQQLSNWPGAMDSIDLSPGHRPEWRWAGDPLN
ncbi:MAG: hypothetical protein WD960_09315 [Gemmatimonadota bacterium]